MTVTQPTRLYHDRSGDRIQRPQDGRRSNLSQVLQSLYDNPQLTRAELARRTGLTKVTISDLVSELIDAGIVEETGTTAGVRPGKPAATLAVRLDSWDVIALDLSDCDVAQAGIYSIGGEKRSVASVSLVGHTATTAVDAILELAEACVQEAAHPILGIGVGTPGTVDADGMVIAAPNFGWYDLPLQETIADHFDLPVSVQNDANAAVVAEKVFADASNDLMRIQISGGVGAGVLLSGTLVLGTSAAAGEIGHMVIEQDGALCPCGKLGCLETWISAPALRKRLADEPDRREQILNEAGRRLGMALSPIVAALDLTQIVLGGPQDLIGGGFLDAGQSLINERTHSKFRRDVTMSLSYLGNEAVLLGAVALVLRTTLGVS